MRRMALAVATMGTLAFAVLAVGSSTPAQGQTGCPNGTEMSQGVTVCSPYLSPTQPAGATAQCNDDFWSFALTHQGQCSGHGGVRFFIDAVTPTTTPTNIVVTTPTTVFDPGDLQGSRIVSFSAGAGPPTVASGTVQAAGTLPRTGLDHVQQLVELALILVGVGSALVIGRRPGVIR